MLWQMPHVSVWDSHNSAPQYMALVSQSHSWESSIFKLLARAKNLMRNHSLGSFILKNQPSISVFCSYRAFIEKTILVRRREAPLIISVVMLSVPARAKVGLL